jgi:predicted RNA-binding protein with PIN domain
VRTIVLDGYNVIHRSPMFQPDERKDLAAAREKLVNLLSWAVGSEGDATFVLVFDGADVGQAARRAAGSSGRVDVRFSKPPQTADDLIKSLVEEWEETRSDVTVVTSDLEVAQHARTHGATVVLSDLFAASLFREKVEQRIKDATARSEPRAAGGAKGAKAAKGAKTRGRGTAASPTAEGSDAETKPGMTKKERDEWLRLFEEQRKETEH